MSVKQNLRRFLIGGAVVAHDHGLSRRLPDRRIKADLLQSVRAPLRRAGAIWIVRRVSRDAGDLQDFDQARERLVFGSVEGFEDCLGVVGHVTNSDTIAVHRCRSASKTHIVVRQLANVWVAREQEVIQQLSPNPNRRSSHRLLRRWRRNMI